MLIIDSHTHIEGREDSPWFDPPETIIRLMDEAEIKQGIVMTYGDAPGGEYDYLEYVADCVRKYPDRLIGYARINPWYGKEAEEALEKSLSEYKMKGLKLHPLGYRMVPDHQLTINLVNLAARFNAPTLLHCGDEEYTYPLQIERLARACPQAKIILGHMGGYFHVREAIRVAERCPNVYLETSATPYPQLIKEAVRRVGAKRVLFASDGPGCDPRLEVYKVELAGLKKPEEKLIFSDNILEILDRVKN
jgi:predicted TIM-barrel fold metal-dependent hydrolase